LPPLGPPQFTATVEVIWTDATRTVCHRRYVQTFRIHFKPRYCTLQNISVLFYPEERFSSCHISEDRKIKLPYGSTPKIPQQIQHTIYSHLPVYSNSAFPKINPPLPPPRPSAFTFFFFSFFFLFISRLRASLFQVPYSILHDAESFLRR